MWIFVIAYIIATCLEVASGTNFLQATWLPVSYHTTSLEDVNATLQSLSQHGVKRIYVDVWNQGIVYFQSPTMEIFMKNKTNPCMGRDILDWTLQLAPHYQMEVIAWFEYGLMTSYAAVEGHAFAMEVQSRGWLLGEHNNYYWMNASMIEVQDLLTSLLHDALTHYAGKGLNGIQLDDHFGYPESLGGNTAVMNTFMTKIRNMVARFNVRQQEAGKPPVLLSLAPSIKSMSLDTYCVDWDLWGEQKLYDEVIPQLYRSDITSYISIFQDTMNSISPTTKSLWIASGIRLDGSGSPTPQADVTQMIQYTKSYGIGDAIWYGRGIIETYPDSFLLEW